jgi:hypothetical protein
LPNGLYRLVITAASLSIILGNVNVAFLFMKRSLQVVKQKSSKIWILMNTILVVMIVVIITCSALPSSASTCFVRKSLTKILLIVYLALQIGLLVRLAIIFNPRVLKKVIITEVTAIAISAAIMTVRAALIY